MTHLFSTNAQVNNHNNTIYQASHTSHTNNQDKTWTPVLEITRQFKISKLDQSQVMRRQYPLRPAAAKTILRCQGDTLNEVVVDLPSSSREHMHYVAE